MDAELLAERLAADEAALIRQDQRLDAIEEAVSQCQSLLTSLSDQTSTNDLISRLAILEGERQVAQEERLAAEAAAMEAAAEAAQAEAEALSELVAVEEEIAEENPEPEVEIIETEPTEEPPPPPPSNRNELEEMTRGG